MKLRDFYFKIMGLSDGPFNPPATSRPLHKLQLMAVSARCQVPGRIQLILMWKYMITASQFQRVRFPSASDGQ